MRKLNRYTDEFKALVLNRILVFGISSVSCRDEHIDFSNECNWVAKHASLDQSGVPKGTKLSLMTTANWKSVYDKLDTVHPCADCGLKLQKLHGSFHRCFDEKVLSVDS